MSDPIRVTTSVSPGHSVEGEIIWTMRDPDTDVQVAVIRYKAGDEFAYVARVPGQYAVVLI